MDGAEGVFETLRQPLLILAPDLRVELANPAFYRTFQVSPDEVKGRPVSELGTGWSASTLRARLEEILPKQTELSGFEVSGEFPRIGARTLMLNACPLPHPDAKTQRILLVIDDVTERSQGEAMLRTRHKELERRVAECTADLAAANKELDTFAYSVAHDLRAPLRTIDGFSQILLDDYGQALDLEAKRVLNLVRESAAQMSELINALLAFSRLSRQPLNLQTVDLTALARTAFEDTRPAHGHRRVELAIADLPPARGDPVLLRQVFANLLDNALKFTRPREVAVIAVGCQGRGGAPVYFVRDNGVAFDMQYASKLFAMFQRLHRTDEFEGIGAGLAIAQRILGRHGGRIWAEARLNEGATFLFTIAPGT